MEKCSKGNDCIFSDGHYRCKPIFYFKHESWGNDFQEIRAVDMQDAAHEFAILFNEDYALMDSEEEVIISDGKIEKTFIVSAEPDIHYSVEESKGEG